MQRVVGGELGGRRLMSLPGSVRGVRPTSSKLRGAIFDRLQGEIVGARFLDPFAGSGAVSIEALSRGASSATLVEKQRALVHFLGRQLAALGLDGRATVRAGDAARVLRAGATPHEVAFLDPPYEDRAVYGEVARRLVEAGWLAPGAVIIAEHFERAGTEPLAWPSALRVEACKRYGQHRLDFLRFTGDNQTLEGTDHDH